MDRYQLIEVCEEQIKKRTDDLADRISWCLEEDPSPALFREEMLTEIGKAMRNGYDDNRDYWETNAMEKQLQRHVPQAKDLCDAIIGLTLLVSVLKGGGNDRDTQ